MNFFENYSIVAIESDNVTFYACKIIKVTSGFNFKKTNFFARWRQHPQNSWNIFQIQITQLFRRLQGPHGCLEKRNHPLSWNLVVWCAKIGLKTKKLRKTIEKPSFLTFFFVSSEVFWTFLVLGPILAHQTTKFELSGWFPLSRHLPLHWLLRQSGAAVEHNDAIVTLSLLGKQYVAHTAISHVSLIQT